MKPKGDLPSLLTVTQATAIMIGIVVGIGIFKTPPIVASHSSSEATFLALWAVGGFLTFVGALCYAELSTADPSPGGEISFLRRAYGEEVGFLFAWGRITVMQSGAIAAVAFAYGDYASTILPIGTYGAAIHAALAVVVLSLLQIMGTGASGRVQVALTALTIVLIFVLAAAGFVAEPMPVDLSQNGDQSSGLAGLALVFILLTYGGWNEASYLSGEIKDVRRKMVFVLLMGTGIVVALYMVFNFSLAYSLGVEKLAKATTVTGPIEVLFGSWGSAIAGTAICIAALSTLNGTLFTGGRSVFALGQSFAPLRVLGKTNSDLRTPAVAIASQSVISLSLIGFGALQRDGFTAMVEYTAPVFWGFMLLAGVSLFLFRWREPTADRPFHVPFYPITPLLFCATSAYLLHASLAYTGAGALIGVAVLSLGIPIYWLSDNRQASKPATSTARTSARR